MTRISCAMALIVMLALNEQASSLSAHGSTGGPQGIAVTLDNKCVIYILLGPGPVTGCNPINEYYNFPVQVKINDYNQKFGHYGIFRSDNTSWDFVDLPDGPIIQIGLRETGQAFAMTVVGKIKGTWKLF